ncbi:response regulator transcription factor [Primorskyibacter sp. 2E107]|uniref:response regulator transcription factor n=1 Tax=Primorskyibacter sp. 2E107 TaxID=3403458 RepID=UPI003AF93722
MVLIVESNSELALLWQRHLERLGRQVWVASSDDEAFELLREITFKVIILDLVLDQGSALSVSDYASYRQPDAQVIFVTNTNFFSDGSIFAHCANACAFVTSATAPADLAAMADHYGQASVRA